MNLKLCYITGWSLLVATGLSAQNRGDLAVKVARDSGQVIELTLQEAVDMPVQIHPRQYLPVTLSVRLIGVIVLFGRIICLH